MSELRGKSHLDRLREWAEGRGLDVTATPATPFDRVHVVAVVHGGDRGGPALVKRESSDSMETAAFYVWNVLDALGALGDG